MFTLAVRTSANKVAPELLHGALAMTAAATDLATLSSARINKMTAALLGQPVKRAASKADAIARYERAVAAAAPVTVAEPAADPAPVEAPARVVEEVAPAPGEAGPRPQGVREDRCDQGEAGEADRPQVGRGDGAGR